MTINLFDIPAATSAYIDNEVDVEVTRVTANLEDGEEGTFTVRVTNASEPNVCGSPTSCCTSPCRRPRLHC